MLRNYVEGDEPILGYRLVRFIGQGGFGSVWEAKGPGGIKVALKIIPLGGIQGRKEFRSLQLVKEVRYPNLVPIFAFWMKDQRGQILEDEELLGRRELDSGEAETRKDVRGTMQLGQTFGAPKPTELIIAMGVGERNLFDRLEECRVQGHEGIPVDELLRYMVGAAKAIDFLNSPVHDLGSGPVAIQHCDIKPHNILVVGNEAQICDFGLSRVVGLRVSTTTGSAATLAYGAPECLKGLKPSPTTDQYSLAITYCELRTGRLPYEAETIAAVTYAALNEKQDLSGLPPAEQEVIRRATRLEPKERWSSCEVMVEALREARRTPFALPMVEPGYREPAAAAPPVDRPTPPPPPPTSILPEEPEPQGEPSKLSHSTIVAPSPPQKHPRDRGEKPLPTDTEPGRIVITPSTVDLPKVTGKGRPLLPWMIGALVLTAVLSVVATEWVRPIVKTWLWNWRIDRAIDAHDWAGLWAELDPGPPEISQNVLEEKRQGAARTCSTTLLEEYTKGESDSPLVPPGAEEPVTALLTHGPMNRDALERAGEQWKTLRGHWKEGRLSEGDKLLEGLQTVENLPSSVWSLWQSKAERVRKCWGELHDRWRAEKYSDAAPWLAVSENVVDVPVDVVEAWRGCADKVSSGWNVLQEQWKAGKCADADNWLAVGNNVAGVPGEIAEAWRRYATNASERWTQLQRFLEAAEFSGAATVLKDCNDKADFPPGVLDAWRAKAGTQWTDRFRQYAKELNPTQAADMRRALDEGTLQEFQLRETIGEIEKTSREQWKSAFALALEKKDYTTAETMLGGLTAAQQAFSATEDDLQPLREQKFAAWKSRYTDELTKNIQKPARAAAFQPVVGMLDELARGKNALDVPEGLITELKDLAYQTWEAKCFSAWVNDGRDFVTAWTELDQAPAALVREDQKKQRQADWQRAWTQHFEEQPFSAALSELQNVPPAAKPLVADAEGKLPSKWQEEIKEAWGDPTDDPKAVKDLKAVRKLCEALEGANLPEVLKPYQTVAVLLQARLALREGNAQWGDPLQGLTDSWPSDLSAPLTQLRLRLHMIAQGQALLSALTSQQSKPTVEQWLKDAGDGNLPAVPAGAAQVAAIWLPGPFEAEKIQNLRKEVQSLRDKLTPVLLRADDKEFDKAVAKIRVGIRDLLKQTPVSQEAYTQVSASLVEAQELLKNLREDANRTKTFAIWKAILDLCNPAGPPDLKKIVQDELGLGDRVHWSESEDLGVLCDVLGALDARPNTNDEQCQFAILVLGQALDERPAGKESIAESLRKLYRRSIAMRMPTALPQDAECKILEPRKSQFGWDDPLINAWLAEQKIEQGNTKPPAGPPEKPPLPKEQQLYIRYVRARALGNQTAADVSGAEDEFLAELGQLDANPTGLGSERCQRLAATIVDAVDRRRPKFEFDQLAQYPFAPFDSDAQKYFDLLQSRQAFLEGHLDDARKTRLWVATALMAYHKSQPDYAAVRESVLKLAPALRGGELPCRIPVLFVCAAGTWHYPSPVASQDAQTAIAATTQLLERLESPGNAGEEKAPELYKGTVKPVRDAYEKEGVAQPDPELMGKFYAAAAEFVSRHREAHWGDVEPNQNATSLRRALFDGATTGLEKAKPNPDRDRQLALCYLGAGEAAFEAGKPKAQEVLQAAERAVDLQAGLSPELQRDLPRAYALRARALFLGLAECADYDKYLEGLHRSIGDGENAIAKCEKTDRNLPEYLAKQATRYVYLANFTTDRGKRKQALESAVTCAGRAAELMRQGDERRDEAALALANAYEDLADRQGMDPVPNYREAVRILKSLTRDPWSSLGAAHLYLGRCYYKFVIPSQLDPEQLEKGATPLTVLKMAKEELERALDSGGDKVEAHWYLAKVCESEGDLNFQDPSKADECYRSADSEYDKALAAAEEDNPLRVVLLTDRSELVLRRNLSLEEEAKQVLACVEKLRATRSASEGGVCDPKKEAAYYSARVHRNKADDHGKNGKIDLAKEECRQALADLNAALGTDGTFDPSDFGVLLERAELNVFRLYKNVFFETEDKVSIGDAVSKDLERAKAVDISASGSVRVDCISADLHFTRCPQEEQEVWNDASRAERQKAVEKLEVLLKLGKKDEYLAVLCDDLARYFKDEAWEAFEESKKEQKPEEQKRKMDIARGAREQAVSWLEKAASASPDGPEQRRRDDNAKKARKQLAGSQASANPPAPPAPAPTFTPK